MKIISIIGIDGSGKTTLSRLLVKTYQSRGIRVVHIYGRFLPYIVKIFWDYLWRLFNPRKENSLNDINKYYHSVRTSIKKRLFRNPLIAALYIATIVIDYIIQMKIKLHNIPKDTEVLLFDRYYFDTVIYDLVLPMRVTKSWELMIKLCIILSKLLPKPDKVIYLRILPTTSFRRKHDTVLTLREIHELIFMYDTLSIIFKDAVTVVNAERPIKEVFRDILRKINNI